VHHHHGDVLVALHRDLVLHVHLVDGDLAGEGRRVRAEAGLGNRLVLAADEEAALLPDRERSRLLRLRERGRHHESGGE